MTARRCCEVAASDSRFEPFTGGCMCGAVRYECSAEPIAMGNCHCRDCQRATGSAFAAAVLVPISAVNVRGEVKYYEAIGEAL